MNNVSTTAIWAAAGCMIFTIISSTGYAEKTGADESSSPFIKKGTSEHAVTGVGTFPDESDNEQQLQHSDVEISFAIVYFQREDIEALSRKSVSASSSSEDIKEMWLAGQGHLVGNGIFQTTIGSESSFKSVKEMIYPTQYIVRGKGVQEDHDDNNDDGDDGADINNNDSCIKESDDVECENFPENTVEFRNFETREVGFLFSFIAEFVSNDYINLTMVPERIELSEHWTEDQESMRNTSEHETWKACTPTFQTFGTQGRLRAAIGETTILGGFPYDSENEIVYFFITPQWPPKASKANKIDL